MGSMYVVGRVEKNNRLLISYWRQEHCICYHHVHYTVNSEHKHKHNISVAEIQIWNISLGKQSALFACWEFKTILFVYEIR